MGLCNCSYGPFCEIYYAITRRTITIIVSLGNFAIGFIYGLIFAIINPNYDEEVRKFCNNNWLVTAPILAKKGEKARKYDRKK